MVEQSLSKWETILSYVAFHFIVFFSGGGGGGGGGGAA